MEFEERFTDQELEQVISEGLIYMCACPAQLAETIRTVRRLYRYQLNCIAGPDNDGRVHSAIAQAAIETHSRLQDCMEDILRIEQWDRATLRMPDNLRAKQLKAITDD
jgi:hypothetical protein